MRTTIRKFFGVWDYEREEQWLNKMAAMGLGLVKVGWCKYVFEECEKGEYTYRVQLLKKRVSHPESAEYIEFVESTGAQFVDNYLDWVYFRKKSSDGEFELFSDNATRIKHIKTIIALVLLLGGVNLYIGAYNLFLCFLWGTLINLLGAVNVVIFVLCMICCAKLHGKIRKMKKEQQIFE